MPEGRTARLYDLGARSGIEQERLALLKALREERIAAFASIDEQRLSTLDRFTQERVATIAAIREERIDTLQEIEAISNRIVTNGLLRSENVIDHFFLRAAQLLVGLLILCFITVVVAVFLMKKKSS